MRPVEPKFLKTVPRTEGSIDARIDYWRCGIHWADLSTASVEHSPPQGHAKDALSVDSVMNRVLFTELLDESDLVTWQQPWESV